MHRVISKYFFLDHFSPSFLGQKCEFCINIPFRPGKRIVGFLTYCVKRFILVKLILYFQISTKRPLLTSKIWQNKLIWSKDSKESYFWWAKNGTVIKVFWNPMNMNWHLPGQHLKKTESLLLRHLSMITKTLLNVWRSCWAMLGMAISVVEFQAQGYKIRSIFG